MTNKFSAFVNALKERLTSQLPGEPAQYLMAPQERPNKPLDPKDAKMGGVLILLYPWKGEIYLLLTQRAEYPGVHSGQVSFPGGRMEHQDTDLSVTAIRETQEETGVPKDGIQLLGELSRLYIPPSNFMVYPFVGIKEERPEFEKDPVEVKEIIEVPLKTLFDNDIRKEGPIKLANGKTIICPYFDLNGFVVWGATAMILSEFIAMLSKPEPLKVSDYE